MKNRLAQALLGAGAVCAAVMAQNASALDFDLNVINGGGYTGPMDRKMDGQV